ncbi:MAG: NADH-quinone oxidoreductase subunit C, partial [Candidatus Latescibacterota bacterium]
MRELLRYLKAEAAEPYAVLYDLFGIDERTRAARAGLPPADFTVVYHLLSYGRNQDVRLKVGLQGESPSLASITDIWPSANWYEREIWDMFGVRFTGHPNLRRILMPTTWEGHPLRKEHPARATDLEPYQLSAVKYEREHEALQFRPEEWGLQRQHEDSDFLFLNLGPHHPGTHGLLRIILQLDGE